MNVTKFIDVGTKALMGSVNGVLSNIVGDIVEIHTVGGLSFFKLLYKRTQISECDIIDTFTVSIVSEIKYRTELIVREALLKLKLYDVRKLEVDECTNERTIGYCIVTLYIYTEDIFVEEHILDTLSKEGKVIGYRTNMYRENKAIHVSCTIKSKENKNENINCGK